MLMACSGLSGQSKNRRSVPPQNITIDKAEFNRLINLSKGTSVASENKYLNKAKVLANTSNGDMKYIRLKLAAFPQSYLSIQVNGEFSTQVFILSDNHKLSYRGQINEREVLLTKCREDEIVSE